MLAEESVFVGDSQSDIISAKRVGLRVIAVTTGVASQQTLAAEEPTVVIDNLTQLVATIQ